MADIFQKRRYANLVSREPRKFKDTAQGLHSNSHAFQRGLLYHIRALGFPRTFDLECGIRHHALFVYTNRCKGAIQHKTTKNYETFLHVIGNPSHSRNGRSANRQGH